MREKVLPKGGIADYFRQLEAERLAAIAESNRRDELIAEGQLADLDYSDNTRSTFGAPDSSRRLNNASAHDETREYMGASTPELMSRRTGISGAGARGKNRRKAQKRLSWACGACRVMQTEDVQVCTRCGTIREKPGDPHDVILHPAFKSFIENSKASGLNLRHVIMFLTCTPELTRSNLEDVASQLVCFKEEGTREAHERGGKRLFGQWPGCADKVRLLPSTEAVFTAAGVESRRGAGLTWTHAANLACGIYIAHLELLRGSDFGIGDGIPIPEIGIEALVRSTPDEALCALDMIRNRKPILNIFPAYREAANNDGTVTHWSGACATSLSADWRISESAQAEANEERAPNLTTADVRLFTAVSEIEKAREAMLKRARALSRQTKKQRVNAWSPFARRKKRFLVGGNT